MHFSRIFGSVLVGLTTALLLCDQANSGHQDQKKATAKITGTIDCKDKGDFKPDTVVTIELHDTSIQDANAKPLPIAWIAIKELKRFPIPFEISYDPTVIQPKNTYSLIVRITTNDRLDYINDTQIAVITRNAPTKDVKAAVIRIKKK